MSFIHPDPISRRDAEPRSKTPNAAWKAAANWIDDLPLPPLEALLAQALLRCMCDGRMASAPKVDTLVEKKRALGEFSKSRIYQGIENLIAWGVIEMQGYAGHRRRFVFRVGAAVKIEKRERRVRRARRSAHLAGIQIPPPWNPDSTRIAEKPRETAIPEGGTCFLTCSRTTSQGTTFPSRDARARDPRREDAGAGIEASAHEQTPGEVGNLFGRLGDDDPAAREPDHQAAVVPAPMAGASPDPQPALVADAAPAREPAAPPQPKSATRARVARKAKGALRTSECARLPDGWRPDPMQVAFAVNLGLDAERVAAAFLDHWTNTERGRKTKRADWNLTWQRWCREDAARARARGVPALRLGGGGLGMGRAMAPGDEAAFRSFMRAYPRDKDEPGARAAFADALRLTDAATILRALARWWVSDGCEASSAKHQWHAKNWLARRLWDQPPAEAVADLPDAVLHEVIWAMWQRGESGEADPSGVARAVRAAVGLPTVDGYESLAWVDRYRGLLMLAGASAAEAAEIGWRAFEASMSLGQRKPDWGRFRPVLDPVSGEPAGFVLADGGDAEDAPGAPPAAFIAGAVPALHAGSAAP